MKIGQIESKLTPATGPSGDRRATPAAAPTRSEPSAKVELSSAAAVGNVATEEASFDKAKVERISTAIREGRFQIDAGAIADKLITNAQEVLGRTRN